MSDEEIVTMMKMAQDIAGIKATLNTMINTNTTALEAQQSARSAHHRIDELKKDIEALEKNQNWLPKLITRAIITTLLGGFLGAAIILFTK